MTTRIRSRTARTIVWLAIAIILLPGPAAAKEDGPGGFATAGSVLCSLVYSPVKIAYAASGVVVGSLAWIWSFGSKRVSRPIFRAALLGDYVVLPEHLTGDEKFRFRGR